MHNAHLIGACFTPSFNKIASNDRFFGDKKQRKAFIFRIVNEKTSQLAESPGHEPHFHEKVGDDRKIGLRVVAVHLGRCLRPRARRSQYRQLIQAGDPFRAPAELSVLVLCSFEAQRVPLPILVWSGAAR